MASANIRLNVEVNITDMIRDLILVALAINNDVADAHRMVNDFRANRGLPPVSFEAVQSAELETAGFLGGGFRREYASRLAELSVLKPQN